MKAGRIVVRHVCGVRFVREWSIIPSPLAIRVIAIITSNIAPIALYFG